MKIGKLAAVLALIIATCMLSACAARQVSGVPSSWENTQGIPPVGDQGGPGSCYAWAAAYYYLTHLQWRDYGWDVTDPAHQCSPAFVYNLTNGGVNDGAMEGENARADAFKVFETMGCATMADMPYAYMDFRTPPSETAFRNGMRFRTRATGRIDVRADEGISRLKAHLAGGDLAVLGIYLYANFSSIRSHDTTYCLSQVTGARQFWHDVAIVGYDDTRATADGRGAFRIVNSLGKYWGDNGYFWMSYQAVKGTRTSCGYALYAEDRPRYEPELTVRMSLEYPDRYNLILRAEPAGAGSGTELDFFSFNPRSVAYNVRYPESTIVLDITDLIPAPGNDPALRFRFRDRRSGEPAAPTIRFLEMENLITGRKTALPNAPLTVPAKTGAVEVSAPR